VGFTQGHSIHEATAALIAAFGFAANVSRAGLGFCPSLLMMLSVASRMSARAQGAAPVRTRQASSPKVMSRTWNSSFSTAQCRRARCSSVAASARASGRLVMA